MRKPFADERGLLSLEASIALTVFIFIMLFMYSIFVIFEARNAIGHAMLSAANSLSLDGFATDTLGDDSSLQGFFYKLYGSSVGSNGSFSDSSKWYEEKKDDKGNVDNSAIQSVARSRFVAYLAGGNETEADEILKQLNVANGLAGLDFSETSVQSAQAGDRIELVVRYKLEYEFQVFSLTGVTMRQSCCSKIW